jgi:hypothetical protein
LGSYQHGRFCARASGARIDEIAINYSYAGVQSTEQALSTLVHEMHHLAQQHHKEIYGKPGPGGYHNRRFARAMRENGLMCSNTGRPGGRQTGRHMSDYIIEDGKFDLACRDLIADGFTIRYVDVVAPPVFLMDDAAIVAAVRAVARAKKAASKTRYVCPGCKLHAWAKQGARMKCEPCDMPLLNGVVPGQLRQS